MEKINQSDKITKNLNYLINIKELNLLLFILFICVLFTTFLYRFIASLGLYTSIGTEGIMASLANTGFFFMILQGVLGSFLLPIIILKFINTYHIKGLWWRGLLIFIAPVYILTALWSIMTSLSPWILAISIVSVITTFVILTMVVIIANVDYGIKRVFTALSIMFFLAFTAWLILDFLQITRIQTIGIYALNAYKIAEGIAIILPVYAYFTLGQSSNRSNNVKFWNINKPALIISLFLTTISSAVIIFIQQASQGISIFEATPYFVRVAYKTYGLTLAFPYGVAFIIASFFFIYLLFFSMVIPFKNYKPTMLNIQTALGIAIIYISGLQPIAVYQYITFLIGFIAFATALLNKDINNQKKDTRNSFLEVLKELDNQPVDTISKDI